MKKLILTKGLQASGKSTWAKEQLKKYPGRYKRINRDDLRLMFDNEQFNPKREKFITVAQRTLILEALDAGFHVIVDDTNLNPRYISEFEKLVKGKAQVSIKDFTEAPLERCIEWDLKRKSSVGKDVIIQTYNKWLKPKSETKPIKYNNELPDAIICDLDGTLCLMKNRSPYEWKRVGEDVVNKPVQDVVLKHMVTGGNVIYLSGRDGVCQPETFDWLKRHGMWDEKLSERYSLYMRTEGDNRKDSIVKKELFDKHVKGKYNVLYVLDDRNQVVDVWRDMGLTCFQVAEGDF